MADRSPASFAVGGALVVLLAGLAAYFGAGLADRGTPATAPSPDLDTQRLDALRSRVDALEERLAKAEALAQRALDAASRRAEGTPAEPVKPEEPAAPPPERDNSLHVGPSGGSPEAGYGATSTQMDQLREIAKKTAEGRVNYALSLYRDASKDGAANRLAQSVADASALLFRYGIDGEEAEARVRRAFLDEWERGAREIGPIVPDSLEKADVPAVREKLAALRAATDRALRANFTDEGWKAYETAVAGVRAADDAVLEAAHKKRLSLK